MSELDYDDGLVHGHRWAKEPSRPAAVPAQLAARSADDEGYDDGLVHGHVWARQEASR